MVIMLMFSSVSMASGWVEFPEETVPAGKVWTIKFNDTFSFDDIASVSVANEIDKEFLSMRIVLEPYYNQMRLFNNGWYTPNVPYTIRVVLENGNKYKKNFTVTQSTEGNIIPISDISVGMQTSGSVTRLTIKNGGNYAVSNVKVTALFLTDNSVKEYILSDDIPLREWGFINTEYSNDSGIMNHMQIIKSEWTVVYNNEEHHYVRDHVTGEITATVSPIP